MLSLCVRAEKNASGNRTLKSTVKFLNFRTPENFAVIYLKFKQMPKLRVFYQNDANGKANSEDPDQTEQSDLGLHCSPRPRYMSENLGSLRVR